jgi:hypothetical protein
MDDGRLKAILQGEIDNAIGFLETETVEQRKNALTAYMRDPYGNEVEGRSQIVTGEVAEAVDGMLPPLMRLFTSADQIGVFEPVGPGDEPLAEQATEYCNWVLMKQNPGIAIMHDWFKDAILQKVGIVKAYWDDSISVTKEQYANLTDDELAMLLSDGTMEIAGQETIEQEMDGQVMRVHNVALMRKTKAGKVKVENVPPEEFLISKAGKTVRDTPFVAHRKLITRSDLIAMGFDAEIIMNLPVYNDLEFSAEYIARYNRDEQPFMEPSLDKSMQTVEVFECYLKTDYDGDGIAELRQIYVSGNEILANEETDYVPFYSICPIPIPHRFFGDCPADRTVDLQLIKTTVTRQMLDNMYLQNNTRMGAVEGQVNLDDLLSVTPGGVIRLKNPGALVPIQTPPVGQQAFPLLEYLDQVQAKRTGLTEASQGLDPNILQNVTAAAIAALTQASQGKIELIARVFAETGVKDLFKGLLHLLCKYQDKAVILRMRGQYVQYDPREWSNQYDCTVNVGLGTGNIEQKMAMLSMVLSKQEQMLQMLGPNNPLVSLSQYRATLGKLVEAAGFADSAEFFKPVTQEVDQALAQPQQQGPDPAVQMMMAQAQADIEIKRQKAMADIQLAREKAIAELELKKMEFEAEAQMKAMKVGAGITSNIEIPG